MGYLDSLLGRNEQVVLKTHKHWIVLASSFLVSCLGGLIISILVALTASLTPFAWLGMLLWLLPISWFGLDLLKWQNEQYIVTNRRVIQTEGIINKHVIDSSLEKVNDVVLEQSALGRILNYGKVEILTASEIGVNCFRLIADPVRFKTAMLDAKEEMSAADSFGERAGRLLTSTPPSAGDIPELIAELDELRQKGIVTEEEFQQKKKELLDQI